MIDYEIKNKCVLCSSTKLLKTIKFNKTPLANDYDLKINLRKKKFPLELIICKICKHVQLRHIVNKNLLFSNYLYVSGTSSVFVNHFKNLVNDLFKKKYLLKNDFVVEIGSNDGTLLKLFKDKNVKVLGIDPAKNLVKKSIISNIETIHGFFNFEITKKIKINYPTPKLIIANNVFAHTDELQEFVKNVNILMSKNSIFIFEVQYLSELVKNLYFDMIYHEHTSYHAIFPLINFFRKYNLIIFDIQKISTHGGSLRIFVKQKYNDVKIKKNVSNFLKIENKLNLGNRSTYIGFLNKISLLKKKLNRILKEYYLSNKKIIGYGAPAKATTFIYQLEIQKYFDFVIDDNNLKQNKFLPGTSIKIKGNSFLKKFEPDYIVILAWNFSDSIIKNNKKILKNKVKFLIPFPNIRLI